MIVVVKQWTWQNAPKSESGRFLDIDLGIICVKRSELKDPNVYCRVGPDPEVYNTWWTRIPVSREEEEEEGDSPSESSEDDENDDNDDEIEEGESNR